MDAARPSAASETAVSRTAADPSNARWGRCSTFLLLWSLAEAASIVVYVFAGRLWGFVVAGVLLTLGFIFTCYYLSTTRGSSEESTPPPERRPEEPDQHQQVNGGGVGGLSQGDIEAIPAFEYHAADGGGASGSGSSSSSVEECAVCISAVRDGETVRRLPACGHAFHARCINGWLRGHATCPICRAGIKVVTGDGEPSPVAPAAV